MDQKQTPDHGATYVEQEIDNGLRALEIPKRMHGGIKRWIMEGITPGDFLQAVISNDLRMACAQADPENLMILGRYAKLFHNFAPSTCWGSPEKLEAWQKRGGLKKVGAKEDSNVDG